MCNHISKKRGTLKCNRVKNMKQDKVKYDFKALSVDQFFFPEREQEKSTRRRQLDTMLDTMSETDLKIMSATAKGIEEANNDRTGE